MKTAFSLIALSAAVAACAAPPPAQPPGTPPAQMSQDPRGRQCFYASSVRNFREVGEEAVNVRVGANRIFRLDFNGTCPGLRWSSSAIGLQQRGGGGAICDGLDVDVITNDGSFIPRCTVRSVRRLSDAEVAALPAGEKP